MTEVRFKSVYNGRPRFDFGRQPAPKWLRDAVIHGRIRVDGEKAFIGSRELSADERIDEADVWSP